MIKHAGIEDLAYLIKEAKEHNQEKPIVFLGAGASKSGGIPLASEVADAILERYKEKPKIKRYMQDDGKKDYAKLMDLLEPLERNLLLKEYIDNAKINVTYIYLAQLIKDGYIDYVLTVNFDNLMLRALALCNEFLPTYDMAILKDLATTTFKEKSIIYLHGQSHELWLLNTKEELDKVKNIIPKIFGSIKDRPWIFIGYSGNDPIFDYVVELGRFDKGLYWVSYKNNEPDENVCKNLLEEGNTNSSLIKGYDSDSFMIELCRQLELPQPQILDKPFSALGEYLDNIVDIDDQAHFKTIKERLNISKEQVKSAINEYEEGKEAEPEDKISEQILQKKIISEMLSQKFDQQAILDLEDAVEKSGKPSVKQALSDLFSNWGSSLISQNNDEGLLREATEKYEKAAGLNPENDLAFSNWGVTLEKLAIAKNNDEGLLREATEKYEKAAGLNPENNSAFNNWGSSLIRLARAKNNDEGLLRESMEKCKKATELNPEDDLAFHNWGAALTDLAKAKNNDEWLLWEAIEKCKKATELNPKEGSAFYSWGIALTLIAKAKAKNNDEWLLWEAIEKFEISKQLKGKVYNLACAYIMLGKKEKTLENLSLALENKEITKQFALEDGDFISLREDNDFIKLLERFND